MNEIYTPYAKQALDGAEAMARHYNHAYIGTEHVLACILKMENCSACKRLAALGLDNDDLGMELDRMIGRGDALAVRGALQLTARTRKVLEFAKIEAARMKSAKVGTEHIVTAMLREGESVGAQILFGHDVTAEAFLKALEGSPAKSETHQEHDEPLQQEDDGGDEDLSIPQGGANAKGKDGKKTKTPALNTYGRDLTLAAEKADTKLLFSVQLGNQSRVLVNKIDLHAAFCKQSANKSSAGLAGTDHGDTHLIYPIPFSMSIFSFISMARSPLGSSLQTFSRI
jgi:ATP-dependent Clp protease ATP-binding subunit ClpC